MVKNVNTILCEVADMNRAVAFYRDLLGLTPGVSSPFWSDFSVGGMRIGLHPPFQGGMKEPSGGWILGIEVDDLKALRAILEVAGTKCEDYHDIPGGSVMDFHDLDGNPIQAMQTGVTAKDLA
ncbi:MAG TPA: VOC family protein [Fimbriimonadaceae bacterium]|nr:VOC family protein [Fimbriimonadaceae bacterium]